MVLVRVEDPALFAEIYDGLLGKGYSVLRPGAAGGEEVGLFRARVLGSAAVEASLEDPFGTVVYRARVEGVPPDPRALARALLEGLPAK
jgi:hypothetical protein